MSLKLKCVARGPTSMTNAIEKLDDSLVQLVLIKLPVGSGTFKRNKFVYIHWVGPTCGAVKRGKWNSEMQGSFSRIGPTHAGIEVSNKEDVKNFDALVTRLSKHFVADDGSFSLAKLKEEYEKRLQEELKNAAKKFNDDGEAIDEEQNSEDPLPEDPKSPVRKRKLAKELGLEAKAVLKAINHDDMGPLNWALFEPNPTTITLVEAGSNGVFELLEHCADDKVYFGVVRLSFGSGKFRRTKRIFFQWSGDKVGAVTRGKSNVYYSEMNEKLGPVNCSLHLNGAADKTLEAILSKVSHVFVVDNIQESSSGAKQAFQKTKPEDEQPPKESEKKESGAGGITADAYIEALLEEQKAAASFYNESAEVETDYEKALKSPGGSKSRRSAGAPVEFDVDETVKLIHEDEGGIMWGVFQF